MKRTLLIAIIIVMCRLIAFAQVTVNDKMVIVHRSWGDYIIDATDRSIEINHEDSISTGDRIYYVDATNGSDSNNGLTDSTAWQTLNKVNNATLAGGDMVTLKRGETWSEQLTVPNSGTDGNPITITSHGLGVKPIIDGADVISGFVSEPVATTTDIVTQTEWGNENWWNILYSYTTIYNDSIVIDNDLASTKTCAITPAVLQDGKVYQYYMRVSEFSGTYVEVYDGGATTRIQLNAVGEFSGTYVADDTTYSTDYIYFRAKPTTKVVIDSMWWGEVGEVDSLLWKKTNLTTQPNLMYLSEDVGTLQDDTESCISDGDWYWDSGTDELFVYSASTDPSGDVELAQRKKIVDLGSHEYITVKNLTIQHSNERSKVGATIDYNGGLHSEGGSNITVSGCTIQKNGMYGAKTKNTSYVTFDSNTFLRNGESNSNGVNARIEGYTTGITDITFSNNQCNYGGLVGLYIKSDSVVNHITNANVYGNYFNNNKGSGVWVSNLNSSAIYNNNLDSNGDPDDAREDTGIAVTSCDSLDIYSNTITNQLANNAISINSSDITVWDGVYGGCANVRIFRNYISNVPLNYGIAIAVFGDETAPDMEVFSNVIDSAENGISLYHGQAGSPSSVDIFNNTLYDNLEAGILVITADFPAVIKNNIFYNGGSREEVDATSSTTGLTTSNNLWYRTSGDVLKYNSSTYTTATITNFEASAQNTDPSFTDAANGDFTLQTGSDAISNGTGVGLTVDILGNPIIRLSIGAYD